MFEHRLRQTTDNDDGRRSMGILYWAKVLPEQWELLQIFRKHEIFGFFLRMHFKQTIIHLSKSLNFILIKCIQIISFVNGMEVAPSKCSPSNVSNINYQCIRFSKSLCFPLIRNGERALMFFSSPEPKAHR